MTRSISQRLLRSLLVPAATLAVGVSLTSCDDDEPIANAEPAQTPVDDSPVLGKIKGSLGNDLKLNFTLTEAKSKIAVSKWSGLSEKSTQRDSDELSLEAFLMGPELWTGPPRVVTVQSKSGEKSVTLRFAGRLAVDEHLHALPGNLIENGETIYTAVVGKPWKTAEGVELASYGLDLKVISFDEKSGDLRATVTGNFFDPSAPEEKPLPVDLSLELTQPVAPPEPPEDTAEPEPRPEDTANRPSDDAPPVVTEEAEQNDEGDAAAESEPEVRKAKPVNEEDIEVRRAVPVDPDSLEGTSGEDENEGAEGAD